MPLIGWLNNTVARLGSPVPVESLVSAIGLYVDHLWYQNISLVCATYPLLWLMIDYYAYIPGEAMIYLVM